MRFKQIVKNYCGLNTGMFDFGLGIADLGFRELDGYGHKAKPVKVKGGRKKTYLEWL